MSWIAPLFALNQPRVIDVAALCAAPAPSAPAFTTTDLVQGLNPFADNTAIRQKLQDFTDAGLWRTFCRPLDLPAPDPIPPQPPPADLPPEPPPTSGDEQRMKDLWLWVRFLAQQVLPRGSFLGTAQVVSGTGHIDIADREEQLWPIYAVGVDITVTAKPDYAGRSNGGDFPVYYDLGWFSLDSRGAGQQPRRLQHSHQVESGSVPFVIGMYFNLAPGVTISVRPIYPVGPWQEND